MSDACNAAVVGGCSITQSPDVGWIQAIYCYIRRTGDHRILIIHHNYQLLAIGFVSRHICSFIVNNCCAYREIV